MATEALMRPPPAHQLVDSAGEAEHAFQEAAVTQEEIERFTVRHNSSAGSLAALVWGC
jgi:hypothetical protein